MPVWHASVSVYSKRGDLIPVDELSPLDKARAQALALRLLDGVGELSMEIRDRQERAHHVRRRLTEAEIAALPAAWCAIAATDEGGEGEPWE